MSRVPRADRRFLVPEIVQTSELDCGPAALASLLGGFGIAANYARLREACQTDVDGTSIDSLEEVALSLGLDAAQIIVPPDFLLLPEADALPALCTVEQPNGMLHFVVLWRRHGRLLQVMDPASGRTWQPRQDFLRSLFRHRFQVDPSFAEEWITAEAFLAPLRRRLIDLGTSPDALLATATRGGWYPVAALDAVTRLVARLVATGALRPGRDAATLAERLTNRCASLLPTEAFGLIPARDWSAEALATGEVAIKGAVLVYAGGRREGVEAPPPELRLVEEEEPRPVRELVQAMPRALSASLPLVLAGTLAAAAAVTLEALVLQGLLSGTGFLPGVAGASSVVRPLLAFFALLVLLEVSLSQALLGLGRWLDVHLRISLSTRLPRLGHYYFHSRLTSDLAQRAHELRHLRTLPQVSADLVRIAAELVLTTVGLLWLSPAGSGVILLTSATLLGVAILAYPWLRITDLRLRVHQGGLLRFHLDALLGLVPARAHLAEPALRTQHEELLVKWADATSAFQGVYLIALSVSLVVGGGGAVWLVQQSFHIGLGAGSTLLVLYWLLKLPVLSQDLLSSLQQIPMQHNRLLRFFEILHSPEESEVWYAGHEEPPAHAFPDREGVHLSLQGASTQAGGHTILSDLQLEISAGEHVAIVGRSGSGKSSLFGLLLGWLRPTAGTVCADGALVHGARLARLRRESAWVDPVVQLWNRSLRGNLIYGNDSVSPSRLQAVLSLAELEGVVGRLPGGLDQALGEGGRLLSGGEGQRVRLGRALLRRGARLALLDEPFRGLDRDLRQRLLARARRHWAGATLLFISHDVADTVGFARVLVVHGGRIVEDGAPAELLAREGSRYAALHRAEQHAQGEVWGSARWRRWKMVGGDLDAAEVVDDLRGRQQEDDEP